MIADVPKWISPDAWRPLDPPAIVLKLGETRSPENLLAASRALDVVHAKRYQPRPDGSTLCNVFVADVLTILHAPIPHVFDLGDGLGKRELRANDIVDGLRASKFDGWVPLIGGAGYAAQRATRFGEPTIAVWKNNAPRRTSNGQVVTQNGRVLLKSGHVVLVVPTPPGKSGVYVTGAGTHCVQECPIATAFGALVSQVEFWGHP